MKKQLAIFLSLAVIFSWFLGFKNIKAYEYSQNNNFDDTVLKSVVQIKIYDTYLGQDVSWGTGMAIGGAGTILTNYHVAKAVITNPNRYEAYACVITSLNNYPDCKHLLSATENLFGRSIGSAKYDQNLDLALLFMNQIYIDGTWKSWTDVPLSDWGFSYITLSDYTKDYRDLFVGESVHAIGYPDYGGGKTIQVDGTVTKYSTDQQSGQPLVVSNFKISFGNSGGPVFNSAGELIGVTVACYVDSNGQCTEGLFIPLPTVDWWYANQTSSTINTWNGKRFYGEKDGIPNGVWQDALCTYPLRQNAYYDSNISLDSCTCRSGYLKNLDGECVDETGYVDPNLRYGQPIDIDAERHSLSVLEDFLNKLKTPNNDTNGDAICKKDYGLNSYYTGNMTDKNETICSCLTGYIWEGRSCVNIEKENDICEINVFYFPAAPSRKSDARRMYGPKRDGGCVCPNGYVWEDNVCVINKNIFKNDSNGDINLDHQSVADEEKNLITKIDKSLSKRVSGNILLQVEKNGEGWYVYPDNKKKYYLGRPADAFDIMRNLGLGIKHTELNNYLNSKFPSRLSGKIMLDVEQNGEAYYINPNNLKGYYLNRPADAFNVMREFGLGITNTDIRQIDVGEIE